MTNTDGSVSYWLARLHAGDSGAEEAIWRRFHRQLMRLAARVLPSTARSEADEEDVVNIAFQSFFRRLGEGQFDDVRKRNDLWRLLMSITRRKAILQIRRAHCGKRRSDDEFAAPISPLEQYEDESPTPESLAIQRETMGRLFAVLNEDLQQIAICKLDGMTNQEIAAHIRRSLPTVERRLRLIRQKWEGALERMSES